MNVIRKNKIKLCFSFMVCFVILFSNVSFSQDTENKNILVLKLTCKGCVRLQEFMGIREALGNNKNYDIHMEMMDCVWNNDEVNSELLYEKYRHKFKDSKFDIIVVCDNTSLKFVRKYHDELFKKAPVVFCGVSETEDILRLNPDFFTGIVHKVDIKNTVDIALKIHPDRKNIIIAADETTITNNNKAFQQLEVDKADVEFIFLKEMKLKELQEKMYAFSEKAICLYFDPVKDDKGLSVPMFNVEKLISSYKIPVYSSFESLLGNGIVGGMMTSGYSQGKSAAEMALRILDGEKVSEIPIIRENSNRYMFDFKQMKKYGIRLSDIPEDSIVINEHLNGFFISKEQFYHVVFPCFIIFLLAVIVSQYITIYKLRKAKHDLRESEDGYKNLIELLPVTVCLHSKDRIKFINKAGAEIGGINEADKLVGRSIYEFLHTDYHELFKKRMKEIDNCGTTVVPLSEEKIVTIDGEIVDVDVISKRFYYNGEEMTLTVLNDIRERKRAEELSRSIKDKERLLNETIEYDKLKTEFFANISHELRTPLNVILGAQQMFKFVLEDISFNNNIEKIERYLNMIQQNSFRLIRLVNNLIDITKMDTGFFEIDLQNCNIISIIEDITLSVGDYIEFKNVELVFDTDVEEKIIACDPDKIERIMLNLLSNAVKFTESGGNIKVNIQDGKDLINISVKDNGVGIPEDKLDEIFEKFKQVDKSFKRGHEGSGIGLSLVKSLVQMHKGSIYAESKYGKGSEFVIELPVQIIEDGDVKTISDGIQESHVERINIEFSDIYV